MMISGPHTSKRLWTTRELGIDLWSDAEVEGYLRGVTTEMRVLRGLFGKSDVSDTSNAEAF